MNGIVNADVMGNIDDIGRSDHDGDVKGNVFVHMKKNLDVRGEHIVKRIVSHDVMGNIDDIEVNDDLDVVGNVADVKKNLNLDVIGKYDVKRVIGVEVLKNVGDIEENNNIDSKEITDTDLKGNNDVDVRGYVVLDVKGNVKKFFDIDMRENNDLERNISIQRTVSVVDLRRNAFPDVKQNVNNVGLKGNVDEYFEGRGDVKGSVDDDDVKKISDGDVDLEGGTRVDSERNAVVVVEGNVVIAEQTADKSSLTEPEIDILHDISDDSYEISDEEVNSFDLILKLMKLCPVNLENFSQLSESLSRSLLTLLVRYSLKNRGGVISVP